MNEVTKVVTKWATKGLDGRKAKIAALAVGVIVANEKMGWGLSQQSIYCIVGLAALVIIAIMVEDAAEKFGNGKIGEIK